MKTKAIYTHYYHNFHSSQQKFIRILESIICIFGYYDILG